MNTILEEMADGSTPTQRCVDALEPVVRGLIAENIPAEAIISTLAKLSVLTVSVWTKH